MKYKHSQLPPLEQRPIGRAVLAFFGIMFIVLASATLASGKFHYPNWWGGPVFAPFAILGGIIALIAAVRERPFKPPHARIR